MGRIRELLLSTTTDAASDITSAIASAHAPTDHAPLSVPPADAAANIQTNFLPVALRGSRV